MPAPDEAMMMAWRLIDQIADPVTRQQATNMHLAVIKQREEAIRQLEALNGHAG